MTEIHHPRRPIRRLRQLTLWGRMIGTHRSI